MCKRKLESSKAWNEKNLLLFCCVYNISHSYASWNLCEEQRKSIAYKVLSQ